MCYGHLDPKFALRETEARLKDVASDRSAAVAGWRRFGAVLARVLGRVAGVWQASPLSPLRGRRGEATVVTAGASPLPWERGWGRGSVREGDRP